MNNTNIEWVDITWNPITGCDKISDGCKNCYAERISTRMSGRFGYPKNNPFEVTLHPDKMNDPIKKKKGSSIFVCSMGDIFHNNVPVEYIEKIFNIMKSCSQHIFFVLTKRSKNMLEKMNHIDCYAENIFMGVSVESELYTYRIDDLRQITAKYKFVSYEPLIGEIRNPSLLGIDWAIIGGETGNKNTTRPMQEDWVRHIICHCERKKVKIFFKQWGSCRPVKYHSFPQEIPVIVNDIITWHDLNSI